jgi:hypothetical protein
LPGAAMFRGLHDNGPRRVSEDFIVPPYFYRMTTAR